jgi:hypothetical protein
VEKCISCQFYDRKNAGEGRSPQWGQCRRTAPLLSPGPVKSYMIEGVWPTVRDDDWCGEWKSQMQPRRLGEPLTSKTPAIPTVPRVAPLAAVAAASAIGAGSLAAGSVMTGLAPMASLPGND